MIVGPSPGGIVIGVEFGTTTGGVTDVCGTVAGVVVVGVVAGADVVDGTEGIVPTSTAAPATCGTVVGDAGADVVVTRNPWLVVGRAGDAMCRRQRECRRRVVDRAAEIRRSARGGGEGIGDSRDCEDQHRHRHRSAIHHAPAPSGLAVAGDFGLTFVHGFHDCCLRRHRARYEAKAALASRNDVHALPRHDAHASGVARRRSLATRLRFAHTRTHGTLVSGVASSGRRRIAVVRSRRHGRGTQVRRPSDGSVVAALVPRGRGPCVRRRVPTRSSRIPGARGSSCRDRWSAERTAIPKGPRASRCTSNAPTPRHRPEQNLANRLSVCARSAVRAR